nr:hypothetical protein [uncultured Clostridium sp.]
MKRYFFMEQDKNIRDCICLEQFDIKGPKHIFKKKDAYRLNDTTVLYLADNGGEIAPDFLQSPVYMISEKVQKVLSMYEDSLIFKRIVMIDKANASQMMYYHVLFEEVEGLTPLTERYPDGTEKNICLSREKIDGYRAFMLKDSRKKVPVISLEVAESLLRRNLIGVELKEIEVTNYK